MNSLIEKRKNLENIVDKYQDLIGGESEMLIQEHSISSAKDIEKRIKEIGDKNRLLNIGIIGRVKAGKSSLLNALFFDGRDILPKAATPMTAALTSISYGDKLEAEVEFFTDEDRDDIEKQHEKYKSELDSLTNKKVEDLQERKQEKNDSGKNKNDEKKLKEKARSRAQSRVERELNSNISLKASYEQWEKMENSGVDMKSLKDKEIIQADSLENLSKALVTHVGADGKYMPFTKIVKIKLPKEDIKDISIIDTPGVNDPVRSREERTRDKLKSCDVIFIVTPSGQFMSKEDMDLMDRITTKEGVRELHVVASQIDTQLYGSVKEDNNGDLIKSIDAITSHLAEHLRETLGKLKEDNSEISTTFDSLIEQSREKVIHSAGICQTIKKSFDKPSDWDDGVSHVWNNLKKHYPDSFSDEDKQTSLAFLAKLANIEKINSIVQEVRTKKENIKKEMESNYLSDKSKALSNYQNNLKTYIENETEKIKDGNVEENKKKINELNKAKPKASKSVDIEFTDMIDNLEIDIKKSLMAPLKEYFKETKKDIEGSEKEKSETYQVSVRKFIFFRSTEDRTRTYTSVRVGAVKNMIEEFMSKIESSIKEKAKEFLSPKGEWKKGMQREITKTLRGKIDDDYIDIDSLQKAIRNIINSVEYPDMEYSEEKVLPGYNSGELRNGEAEEFIEDANSYVLKFRKRVEKDIDDYIKKLKSALEKIDLGDSIFEEINAELENLNKQIKNKEIILDRFENLNKELGGVK